MWGSIKTVARRIGRRLRELPVAVKTLSQVLLVVAVILVVVAGSTSEKAIIKIGAFLQLGGFLTVAIGIEKTLQSFGREPFWQRLKGPFDDFWSVFTGRHIKAEVSEEVQVSASASVSVDETVSYSDDLSVGEEINLIKKSVEKLGNRVDDLEERLDEETERLEEKFEEEVNELEEKVRQVREMVETANIGDVTLQLEWFGVYLLIFGILLKTFPGTAHALARPAASWSLSVLGI